MDAYLDMMEERGGRREVKRGTAAERGNYNGQSKELLKELEDVQLDIA